MATTPSKIIKTLPAKDPHLVRYIDDNHYEWLVTSKPDRSAYFLYKLVPGRYELVTKATTPAKFSDMVFLPEKPAKSKR